MQHNFPSFSVLLNIDKCNKDYLVIFCEYSVVQKNLKNRVSLYPNPKKDKFAGFTESDIENSFKVFQSNDTRVRFHLSPFTYPFIGM